MSRTISHLTPAEWDTVPRALAASGAMTGCQTPEHVTAALYYGDGLGLSIGESMRMVQRVQGRLCMTADGVSALVRRHPDCELLQVREWSDAVCAIYSRRQDGSEHTARATIEDARRRKLVRPGSPWESHPMRMLQITAMREIRATLYPDVGSDTGDVVDTTPTPAEHAAADAAAAQPTALERAQATAAALAQTAATAPPLDWRAVMQRVTASEVWTSWRSRLTSEDVEALGSLVRSGLSDDERQRVAESDQPHTVLMALADERGIGQSAPELARAPAPSKRRTAKECANVVRHLLAAGILTDEEASALLTPGVIPRQGLDLADDDTADAATLRALLPTEDPR